MSTEGGGGQKKSQNCVNVVCEQPLKKIIFEKIISKEKWKFEPFYDLRNCVLLRREHK